MVALYEVIKMTGLQDCNNIQMMPNLFKRYLYILNESLLLSQSFHWVESKLHQWKLRIDFLN